MGNIAQVGCTICNDLLILDFMNENKWTAATGRHWIVEGIASLNKAIYFRAAFISGWKFRTKNMLH